MIWIFLLGAFLFILSYLWPGSPIVRQPRKMVYTHWIPGFLPNHIRHVFRYSDWLHATWRLAVIFLFIFLISFISAYWINPRVFGLTMVMVLLIIWMLIEIQAKKKYHMLADASIDMINQVMLYIKSGMNLEESFFRSVNDLKSFPLARDFFQEAVSMIKNGLSIADAFKVLSDKSQNKYITMLQGVFQSNETYGMDVHESLILWINLSTVDQDVRNQAITESAAAKIAMIVLSIVPVFSFLLMAYRQPDIAISFVMDPLTRTIAYVMILWHLLGVVIILRMINHVTR